MVIAGSKEELAYQLGHRELPTKENQSQNQTKTGKKKGKIRTN